MKRFYSSASFKDYLKQLAEENGKPFGCPNLIVLPEDIGAKESPSQKSHLVKYEKGSLICSHKPGWLTSDSVINYRCSFSPKGISINNEGEIESCCGWDHRSNFVLEVKSFERA